MDVLAIATILLALVGTLTFWATWRLAQATHHMVGETKRDSELSRRPYLIAQEEASVGPDDLPVRRITNAGGGPALLCLGILYEPLNQEWYETAVFQLPPGTAESQTLHPVSADHIRTHRTKELEGLGRWDEGNQVREVLVCRDIFGKGHRFQAARPAAEVLSDGTDGRWLPWFTDGAPNQARSDEQRRLSD